MLTRGNTKAILLALGVLMGCKHPERTDNPLDASSQAQPKNDKWTRWETVKEESFTVKDRCFGAPIERSLVAGMSPFGQRINIEIDSPRHLEMGYQILVDGKVILTSDLKTYTSDSTRVTETTNYCQTSADPAPLAEVGTDASGTDTGKAAPAPKGGKGGKGGKSKPAPKESAAPVENKVVTAEIEPSDEKPLDNFSRRPHITSYQISFLQITRPTDVSCYSVKGRVGEEFTSGYDAIPPGATVTVRLYRTVGTRDLQDVIFHISLEQVVPKVSTAEYQAFLESKKAEDLASFKADEAACKKSSDEYWATSHPKTAPPPPTPKKEMPPASPGKGAVWIAGSWRWTGTDYVWDTGFWRLPEKSEVVVAVTPPPTKPNNNPPPATPSKEPPTTYAPTENPPTAYAPTPKGPTAPPPDLKEEVAPTPTQANVVWVPGYWVWVGDGYVWVAGQWQAPPAPEMRWQAPRYDVQLGVQVFVPGKWIKPRK